MPTTKLSMTWVPPIRLADRGWKPLQKNCLQGRCREFSRIAQLALSQVVIYRESHTATVAHFYKDHLHNLFTAQIASSLNSGIKHTTGLEEVGRQQWHLVTTSDNDYTYLNPSLPCWEYYPNITSCPVFISMWALGFDSRCWIDSPVQQRWYDTKVWKHSGARFDTVTFIWREHCKSLYII